MKYRFYYLDDTLVKRTIATLTERSPISVVARKLHDLAFKRFGHAGRIIHDATMVGGYYADPDGNVVAVELDYEGKRQGRKLPMSYRRGMIRFLEPHRD